MAHDLGVRRGGAGGATSGGGAAVGSLGTTSHHGHGNPTPTPHRLGAATILAALWCASALYMCTTRGPLASTAMQPTLRVADRGPGAVSFAGLPVGPGAPGDGMPEEQPASSPSQVPPQAGASPHSLHDVVMQAPLAPSGEGGEVRGEARGAALLCLELMAAVAAARHGAAACLLMFRCFDVLAQPCLHGRCLCKFHRSGLSPASWGPHADGAVGTVPIPLPAELAPRQLIMPLGSPSLAPHPCPLPDLLSVGGRRPAGADRQRPTWRCDRRRS